jgi:hypothetical protein
MTHRSPHDDASGRPREPWTVDEREWQAQERAMRAERSPTQRDADNADNAQAASYRAIDRALRVPPLSPLPPDFAADVARCAQAAHDAGADRVERILTHALIALLGLSVGVISVIYGAQWLPALETAMPDSGGAWLSLVAACAGMHWTMERWRAGHAVR